MFLRAIVLSRRRAAPKKALVLHLLTYPLAVLWMTMRCHPKNLVCTARTHQNLLGYMRDLKWLKRESSGARQWRAMQEVVGMQNPSLHSQ